MPPLRPLVVSSLAFAALFAVAACTPERLTRADAPGVAAAPSFATGRSTTADDAPHPLFVQAASDAPTIANPVVTFWARKGVDTTVSMYYHRASGGRDSIPFFSIRIRPRSLWLRPNGSLIADGDSVQITLTLADAQRLVVDCQPSGLRFDPRDPARVKMSWAGTDDDVNHDGVVNAADSAMTHAFAIWRQESSSEPWLRLVSRNSAGSSEVEADIGGFTGYAIAW